MSFVSRALIIALGSGLLTVSAQSNFPPVAVWEIGQFSASPSTSPDVFCQFTNGAFVEYQTNGDTAVRNAETAALWSAADNDGGQATNGLKPPTTCSAATPCNLVFQQDGNLVSTFGSQVLWTSGTEGRGMWLVCQESAPWLYIVNGAGTVIWSTSLAA